MTRYAGLPPIPERIRRLDELAANLWWSWQYSPRKVFRDLDYQLWRTTAHNPVKMLWLVTRERLEQMSRDEEFLHTYDDAVEGLDAAYAAKNTWMARRFPGRAEHDDRVLLSRVRDSSVAADLCRRPRRARRRSLQRVERPRRAAGRRRLHVSAGILPPDDIARGLAARGVRAAQLARRRHRAGVEARRIAVHRRGAARRPRRADQRLESGGRSRRALPARHGPRRERAAGSRSLRATLRRRSRNAPAAGNHSRHRRRARAARARHRAGGLASERRARRLRRAAAHLRAHRRGHELRRRARGREGARPFSRRTRPSRPATTRSRSIASSITCRARGGRSPNTAAAFWRSANITASST